MVGMKARTEKSPWRTWTSCCCGFCLLVAPKVLGSREEEPADLAKLGGDGQIQE